MRWLVLVGLVACGDNVVVDEPAISHGGDRLELYWNELDGARELASRAPFIPPDGLALPPIRMFDTDRQEDCELIEWADGAFRCTPGLERAFHPKANLAVFADSGCTDVRGLSYGTADYFLYGEWVEDRFLTSLVLLRSGAPSGEPPEYYERRDGGCHGPIPNDGNGLMWNVVASLPGSELVAFSRDDLPTTGLVGHRAFVGDDGSLLRDGFYDREREVPCFLTTTETDVRCAPTEAAEVERTFADPACSQPAVADLTSRFLYESEELTGCPIVYELEAPRMMPVYELDGGQCIQTEVGQYRVGRPIELPAVDVHVSDGAGRIVDVVAAGAPVGVFDTAIRASCSARDSFPFRDDPRCVPSSLGVLDAFSDEICTQAIAVTRQYARTCDRQLRFATQDFETYAEVGEPIDPLFTLIDDLCVPLVPPDGQRHFRLGEFQLKRDELSRAQLVHAR